MSTDLFTKVDAGIMDLHMYAPLVTRIKDTEQLIGTIEQGIRTIIPTNGLQSITDNMGPPVSYNLSACKPKTSAARTPPSSSRSKGAPAYCEILACHTR